MTAEAKSRAAYWAKRLECPVDEDANYRNTFWCNRDLIPIPEDRRTWTWQGFAGYWVISVKIILRAIIGPKFRDLPNTLPVSANVDTASLISFFVFIVIFLPLPMIPPEKLQLPFMIVFVMITATMFGMVGWAVNAAGGAGILMSTPATGSGSALSWAAVFGLQSIVGSQASGCLGQSDWTRYARTPNAALFGQLICAPIFIVVTSVCGIIITSAAASIYDEYIWNPFELLLTVQDHSMSPAARAGTFFAGLGFLVDQLALCQMLNGISTGMDMAALCPKWINIRRGCYILTVIAIAICPWNYVTNPGTFITVLSGWSVFLSPMTGIVVSDYFFVRRGQYHIGDMYMGNSRSAYWYSHGFNWRCFLAWILGMAPLLPGFARAIQGVSSGSGWDHLYQISYFYGFFVSLTMHWLLHTAFPTARQRGNSPFVLEAHAEMLNTAESDEVTVDSAEGEEKGATSRLKRDLEAEGV
ncbi:hypothetical protein Daus18300_004606 [Diaporthe australafricana]|uniref:Uracil permease n=1 Tax=Diaporthe australafricana TaxID=127596 RepID=A0ABR3X8N9_9PEZI